MCLSGLLHEFAGEGLLFAVFDSGGLFEIFALFPLADNAFLLNHSLEALYRFLERFTVFYLNLPNSNHLPSIGVLILLN